MVKKTDAENILIYGDLHIAKDSLIECERILNEISSLCVKHKITTLISLGDNFDIRTPGEEERKLFAKFLKDVPVNKVILIAADSHESNTKELSCVDLYGILLDKVEIVKEYSDGTLYCGHFIAKECNEYGATLPVTNLTEELVFLGHRHGFKEILTNKYQLGSCRYVKFDEIDDSFKRVAIIQNYKLKTQKLAFLALDSVTPVYLAALSKKSSLRGDLPISHGSFLTVSELCQKLDSLLDNTKIKVIVEDFSLFKEYVLVENKYKSKFTKYLRENKFTTETKEEATIKEVPFKEMLVKYMKLNKIDEEVQSIIKKEIK